MTRRTLHGDDGQSESYFISFSDLLIGMIFLFIIILLGYALSFRSAEMQAAAEMARLEQERDRLEAEKAELQARTDEITAVAEDLIRREDWRDDMLEQLAAGVAERGIDVVVDLEKGVLRLPETLLFASGSAALTDRGVAALQDLAIVMDEVMPCFVASAVRDCPGAKRAIVETVLIEGHTDNVPIAGGEFRDNWELSVARGVNTYKALTTTESGIAAGLDNMRNERGEAILGVSGYETRRPVTDNDSETARERNRRIDLRFLIAAPNTGELDADRFRLQTTPRAD